MQQTTLQALLLLGILILLNLIGSNFFARIDLTTEKRYSLSQVSKNIVDSLQFYMTVKVYLYGKELPAPVKRFSEAIRTTLMELKAYSRNKIQYQFIDPTEQRELQEYLYENKIRPIPLRYKKGAELIQKVIFPAAVINYNGKEIVVDLLKSDCEYRPQGVFCNYRKAESELEYKLISHIIKLLPREERIIGFTIGQKEYDKSQMKEWIEELTKFYRIIEVKPQTGQAIPNSKKFLPDSLQKKIKGEGIDVLIVAGPDSTFSERAKYEIDQYIMRGGRVLWLVDKEAVDEKDFYTPNTTALSKIKNLNLDDMFFKYGFKVNTDLVQDDVAGMIDVTFTHENKPIIQPQKWIFFPLIFPPQMNEHPTVRSLNGILLRYASSLDTLRVPGIKKEVIFTSSPYSRSLNGQLIINLNETIANPPPLSVYQGKGNRIMALALEGYFHSVFQYRKAPVDSIAKNPPTAKFIEQTPYPNRMIVVGDGAIVLPNHSRFGGEGMPLDNKTFLMNCIDYLLGNSALTEIRDKSVKIHILDYRNKVHGNELLIQILNLVVPVVAILLFGFIRFTLRKRKNEALKIAA
ncbi:MAG: gliding motility-associated ABC transporter substrate-binding protein GldG [Bacteroidia bacterium]|nr:gliding motility-associated ABC transporter substrate-binding protein GldG [Bacteroidia bacterium]MDW8157699.1 gliding motility-associated ABC transporter substrate-binding protein GldG [Bacteroidia bacterium]